MTYMRKLDEITVRAWLDPEFRAELNANPSEAVKDYFPEINLPENTGMNEIRKLIAIDVKAINMSPIDSEFVARKFKEFNVPEFYDCGGSSSGCCASGTRDVWH